MAMKTLTIEQYKARAEVAKAMGHPTRLLLLDALKQQEMCVCELTELAGADQSTVSKHLAILKNVGLVGDRRDGTMAIYFLRVHCLDGFFGCIEKVLREDLKAREAAVSRRR